MTASAVSSFPDPGQLNGIEAALERFLRDGELAPKPIATRRGPSCRDAAPSKCRAAAAHNKMRKAMQKPARPYNFF